MLQDLSVNSKIAILHYNLLIYFSYVFRFKVNNPLFILISLLEASNKILMKVMGLYKNTVMYYKLT